MSVISAITRYHVEVHDSTLADCKEQENFSCSDIDDYRFTVETERHKRLLSDAPPKK